MLLGNNLSSINLLICSETGWMADHSKPMIDFIIEGCPKLKSLTLESLRGWKKSPKAKLTKSLTNRRPDLGDVFKDVDFSDIWDLTISKESLEALYKSCKELKDLKLTKIDFEDIFTEDEIKKILPGCNVEIKECYFKQVDDG